MLALLASSHRTATGYAVFSFVGFRTAEAVLQRTAGFDIAGPRSTKCGTATGLQSAWLGVRGRFHGTRGGAKGYGSVHGYRGMVLAGLLVAPKSRQCGTATNRAVSASLSV